MSKLKQRRATPPQPQKSAAPAPVREAATNNLLWLLGLGLLLLLIWVVYAPTLKNDFTKWDDHLYVTENPLIRNLSFDGLKAMFSTKIMEAYTPLTLLSLALDYAAGKLNPLVYHRTNLLLHLLNTVLVYWLVRLLLPGRLSALIMAAVFALHPMHVESVAWVSERKDVLFGLFYLLAAICYLRYLLNRDNRWLWYWGSIVCLLLSLLAKPQAVTLPVLLLLFDWFRGRAFSFTGLADKLPHLILALLFGIITLWGNSLALVLLAGEEPLHFTLFERIQLSGYALVMYLYKFFLPLRLSALYPFPDKGSDLYLLQMYVLPAVAMAVTLVVWLLRHRFRTLFLGYGFFLITIGIVLHLVAVNSSPVYERFTYLPYIGLCLPLAVKVEELLRKNNTLIRTAVVAGAVLLLFWLGTTSRARTAVWKDSISLWSDVVSKFPDLTLAWYNRGVAYFDLNQYSEAIHDYTQAIRTQPAFVRAYNSRGIAYSKSGKYTEAIADHTEAIRLRPALPESWNNRGDVYNKATKYESALADFSQAIRLRPTYADAWYNRGIAQFHLEHFQQSVADYTQALRLNPEMASAWNNRSGAYYRTGRPDLALADAQRAQELGVEVNPDYLKFLQEEVKRRPLP